MDAQSLLVEVSANILQERQKDKVTLMSLSDEHKGAQLIKGYSLSLCSFHHPCFVN